MQPRVEDALGVLLFQRQARVDSLCHNFEMVDLKVFYATLLRTFADIQKAKGPAFFDQFNNSPEFRTARNRVPRTDLMLGCGKDNRAGVVPKALSEFLCDSDVQLSYERYLDLIAFAGQWWEGRRIARAIAEVENNIAEFEGTLSDLLRYQAQQKIAYFTRTPQD